MVNYSEKIRTYAGAYRSGIYTKDEVIGAVMGLLVEAPDFRLLWSEVPDWVQQPIQQYLNGCDESTTLYDSSSKASAPIDPKLLELKGWLASK